VKKKAVSSILHPPFLSKVTEDKENRSRHKGSNTSLRLHKIAAYTAYTRREKCHNHPDFGEHYTDIFLLKVNVIFKNKV
jgi:hypothetical protein